jgi:hypothetical protein
MKYSFPPSFSSLLYDKTDYVDRTKSVVKEETLKYKYISMKH